MKIVVFEDGKHENFYPLTLLRPVFELKCGSSTLLARILRKFGEVKPAFFVRDDLAPTLKKKFPASLVNDLRVLKDDDLLLLNGRWLISDEVLDKEGREEIGMCNDDIVYIRIKKGTDISIAGEDFSSFLEKANAGMKKKEFPARLILYPWELVKHNGPAISEDFAFLGKSGLEGKVSPSAVVYGPQEKAYVARTAEVHPFVTLDTTQGPVIIDEEAIVFPYSRIEGPSYVGKGTHICGANIRLGCSIGPVCRVGGEVEETIIHGYTNKFHDGFLGHSYLGEWVNLGALTTNSDIKNDYSPVQVYIKGQFVDSGETKVGSFIGDHTKTSIGTFLNTGAVIGLMCNVLGGGGVLPKFIPSFSWFLKDRLFKGYGFKMMVKTAEAVMVRRGCRLEEEEVALLEVAYHIVKEERDALIKKDCKHR